MTEASVGSSRGRGRPAGAGGSNARQDILRAAREVFSEAGYHGATFMEIAAHADVTRPAVNHYFPNKAALYSALFDSIQAEVVAGGIAQAEQQTALAARIATFLAAAVRADSKDRTYARFIASSLLDSYRHPEIRERAQSQLDGVRQFVSETLEAAMDSGDIDADIDVTAVTEMLVAVMWGMSMYAGFVGTHEQLESVVEQFTRLLDGSLW